ALSEAAMAPAGAVAGGGARAGGAVAVPGLERDARLRHFPQTGRQAGGARLRAALFGRVPGDPASAVQSAVGGGGAVRGRPASRRPLAANAAVAGEPRPGARLFRPARAARPRAGQLARPALSAACAARRAGDAADGLAGA